LIVYTPAAVYECVPEKYDGYGVALPGLTALLSSQLIVYVHDALSGLLKCALTCSGAFAGAAGAQLAALYPSSDSAAGASRGLEPP